MWAGMFPLMVRGQFCKILNSTLIRRSAVNYVQNHSFMSFSRRDVDANTVITGTVKEFSIVPASTEHRALIAQCLRSCYYRDEPLVSSVGLTDGVSPVFEDYILDCLGEGLSFFAVGGSPDDILGTIINAKTQANEPVVTQELLNCAGVEERTLMELDEFCYRHSDLFRRCSVSHFFDMRNMGVMPKARRSGLAKALTARSLQLAKELAFPMACMLCSSEYSARLARSLGMSEAWSVAYKEYLNAEKKPVFRPSLPHTHMRMMVLKLE